MAGSLGPPQLGPIGGSDRLCRAARRHARLILATDELRLPRLTHGALCMQAQPTYPRRHVCMQSGKGIGPLDGGSNEEGADIDALAKMLSQQAAKLRASMSEEDMQELLAQEAREQVVFSQVAARMGPQLTAELEARVMAEVGDGGFTSDDFEILNRLGRISVAPASGPTAGSPPCTAVIAYVARYIARQAYALPVTTLIKEFLPVAKSVAYNELLLLQHLCGLPDDKYQAAVSRPNQPGPPVVPLLGYFLSAPSEDAEAESQHGGAAGAVQEEEDSLWLVYKWEGMRPLNLYMDAGPPEPQHGFFKPKETAIAEAWARRMAMLRSLARGLLSAIDFIHSGDVVHGALSSGSVLMSTSTDLQHPDEDLVVKIDGFGFGKWFSASASRISSRPLQPSSSQATEYGPVMLDAGLEEGKRADLQAAALLLAEAFSCGLADGPGGQMTATTARRLLFDFQENSMAFRDYCLKDPENNFSRLVSFLDERQGAGWAFMDALMAGQHTGLELSQHAFLRPKP